MKDSADSNASIGTRRGLRDGRARRRRLRILALRRRWSASAVATILAGAMILAGVSQATAETATPSPAASETGTVAPTPETSQPAPEASESAPAPEASEPGTPQPEEVASDDPALAPQMGARMLESSAPTIGLMAVGPEVSSGPYLYWDLRTANNDSAPLVGGGSFDLSLRNAGNTAWGSSQTVVDCTVAPCTGLDRDPDAGEFQIVSGDSGVTLATNQRWRIKPSASPATWGYGGSVYQFTSSTSTWVEMANASEWVTSGGVSSKDFGNLVAAAIPSTQSIVVRTRVLADPTAVGGSVAGNIGTDYSYTVGTVFRLYENTSNAPGAATGFTCTVASGGECTITVTDVQNGGANYNKRYWVVEEAPVAGSPAASAYSNPSLYVGSFSGPTELRRLVGLTKQVTATSAQYLPMVNAGVTGGTELTTGELPGSNTPTVAEAASFGAMANSLNNPVIQPKCTVDPLRIALVLDQSASISSDQWTTFRSALVGTGSSNDPDSVLGILKSANSLVSILGFGTNVASPNGWHYGASGPAALPANFGTLIPTTRPGGNTNRTNWDSAMSTIAGVNGTHDYDMVLFVTDGAPNYILGGTGVSGDDVTLRSLEAPLYAANAIKAAGTRVVAVGVGNGASGPQVAANLRAMSGQVSDSDYIQGDWEKLKDILTDVVKAATCTLPIEVSKTTVAANGTTTTNAAGWQFTATKTGDGSTLSTPAQKTTAAGPTGTAKWNLNFTQPSGQTATLTLTETGQSDWTLTSVACTVAGVSVPVTITNGGVTLTGLTTSSQKVFCVFTNTQAQFGSLAITKAFGTPMPPGNGPAGVTFSGAYSCTLNATTVAAGTWSKTGTGAAVLTPTTPSGSAATSQQVPAGASCTVTETAPTGGMPNASWVWDTPAATGPVTIVNGQTATVTVTNKAKRVYGNFQVTKNVPAGSTTDAANQYSGGWTCVLGGETVTGTWGPILKGATWSSTNANVIPVGAQCSVTSETRPDWPVAADHSYQWDGNADLGTAVAAKDAAPLGTVTVTNRTTRVLGSVTWTKVDAATAQLLSGSQWRLIGPGGVTVTVLDCVSAPCSTAPLTDQDAAPGAFRIVDLAWGDYTVTETLAPPGYLIDATAHPFTIKAGSVSVALGAFTNTSVTPPTIPLTGGVSRDAYLIGGLAALLFAFSAFCLLRLRTNRRRQT